MSKSYSLHPVIDEGVLQYLVDRGFQLLHKERDTPPIPISPAEAIDRQSVGLRDDLLGRANWVWLWLGPVAGRSCLISVTRYLPNGAWHVLDAIARYAGDRVYILEEGSEPEEWVPARLAEHPGGSWIAFWRVAPEPIYPGRYPRRPEGVPEGGPQDRDYQAAVARYHSDRQAWIEPRLRPEDYLAADFESRRAARPTGEQWAAIRKSEAGSGMIPFFWLLYLAETSSVVPLGGQPLDWQRDEHDRLIAGLKVRGRRVASTPQAESGGVPEKA